MPLHTIHYTLNAHKINFRIGEGITVPPMTLAYARLINPSNSRMIVYLKVICMPI
jgi:hypothetical protein